MYFTTTRTDEFDSLHSNAPCTGNIASLRQKARRMPHFQYAAYENNCQARCGVV